MDSLPPIPCLVHHRDGGYLCLEPKTDAVEPYAAIADDKDVIPYRKYILEPRGCASNNTSHGGVIRSKSNFYDALDNLIGKEVAIKDAETGKHLASEYRMYGKPLAKFKDTARYFCIERTDTGAYRFVMVEDRKRFYLHKSSKLKSWAMKGTRGPAKNIEVDVDTSQVSFSPAEGTNDANDWVIEPDDSIIILDTIPAEKVQIAILFLGVIDMKSSGGNLEVGHHFRHVAAAWRTKEEWNDAIASIKSQCFRGEEYCIHIGRKTKWIARCTDEGKFCVVISSSNFHQEHLEDCVDKMEGMLGVDKLTSNDLRELGLQTQMKGGESSKADHQKLHNEARASGITSTFERMQMVPISLLHRSGGWFSLDKDGKDLLYLVPFGSVPVEEVGTIESTGDYFDQLGLYQKFAIRDTRGMYLTSKEQKNMMGNEKKHLFRRKQFAAEFTALKSLDETPEMFTLHQHSKSGGISITSVSHKCFLTRNRRGYFIFKESAMPVDADGRAGSSREVDGEWFVDAADLHSGLTSDGILFACIVRSNGKKVLVSKHTPGRPTAWRTDQSWNCILDILLENMKIESSTVVRDSDTGNMWFATKSTGKELFIVTTSAGFPLYYGTKALMEIEDAYNANGCPSSGDLYRAMRNVDTEYRYELCFGNNEVLGLIEDVEELTYKMMSNIDGLQENIETGEEIAEKAHQLHALAQQFKKKSNKTKWKVAGAAVAGGAVVGGLFGLLVGCPAGVSSVVVLESQMAEVALSASVGAAPGLIKGAKLIATDKFWKRRFVNFGKSINSRHRERAREKRRAGLKEKGAECDYNMHARTKTIV